MRACALHSHLQFLHQVTLNTKTLFLVILASCSFVCIAINLAAAITVTQLKVQEGVCLKCSDKVRHSGNGRPVDVIKTNGTIVDYIDSKCHPQMTPRYSTRTKIAGSALHIATAGIPYAIAKISKGRIKTWLGIFNEEKWCISCKAKPGFNPCSQVDTVYSSTAGMREKNHTCTCKTFCRYQLKLQQDIYSTHRCSLLMRK